MLNSSKQPGAADDFDYDQVLEFMKRLQNKAKDEELNRLLERSERMLQEVGQISEYTRTIQVRMNEANRCMTWTEKRLEDMRREQNQSAAIVWNFPDDLYPTMLQSAPQQEKTEAFMRFLIDTVQIPDDLVRLIAIQHIRVFYTVFQSERSANVRLQFADDESKQLCESYCVPFLKTFNQMRSRPTRWREDQTEMQRDQEKEQQRQKQKQQQNGGGGGGGGGKSLLFTKFIQWPPPQRA